MQPQRFYLNSKTIFGAFFSPKMRLISVNFEHWWSFLMYGPYSMGNIIMKPQSQSLPIFKKIYVKIMLKFQINKYYLSKVSVSKDKKVQSSENCEEYRIMLPGWHLFIEC